MKCPVTECRALCGQGRDSKMKHVEGRSSHTHTGNSKMIVEYHFLKMEPPPQRTKENNAPKLEGLNDLSFLLESQDKLSPPSNNSVFKIPQISEKLSK